MLQVSIRELKAGLSAYLRRVRSGETLLVASHNKPVAKITAYADAEGLNDGLRRLIKMDGVEWDGRLPDLPVRTPKLEGDPAARAVLESRR